MISLIYGGSGSGKSEYAEGVVLALSGAGSRYYVATMKAYGEEGRKRVERHRKLRSGKGFQTIECPVNIAGALEQIPDPSGATVLLECVSNLLANEMFDTETSDQGSSAVQEDPGFADRPFTDQILEGLSVLCSRVKHTVIVSNNIFEDGTSYDEWTVRYMQYLGEINCRIAAMADHVTEVVAGIPVPLR